MSCDKLMLKIITQKSLHWKLNLLSSWNYTFPNYLKKRHLKKLFSISCRYSHFDTLVILSHFTRGHDHHHHVLSPSSQTVHLCSAYVVNLRGFNMITRGFNILLKHFNIPGLRDKIGRYPWKFPYALSLK